MAIDIIARGMIESSNGDISKLSEKVSNHTNNSDIHVTVSDKENWNSHPNDVQASGNPVTLDGLQGGVPFSEMVVSGKNLIPFPYYDGMSKTHNGITFTVNPDGSVTANGTATATAIFYISTDFTIKKGTYALSGCPKSTSETDYILQIATSDWSVRFSDSGNGNYRQMDNDINFQIFRIAITNGVTVDNVVFRPQLEIGTTATAYEPPITGRELTVNVSGKNMFDGNLIIGMIQTGTGILTGGTKYLSTPNYISVNGNCTYSLSNFENIQFDAVVFYDFNKSYISATPLNRVEPFISHFTTPQNCKYIRWRYLFDNGASIDMLTNIQLELGDTVTAYEPYHGSTTTITPDSNPYVIPNDIRQVEGLNNISVSEGELSVVGVRKNAAVKKIWDEMGMDLLFDGVTSVDNPAVIDLANYKFVEIHHIMIANEKTYPVNIRLSLDSYLSSASTITTPISNSTINTVHTEEGTVWSLYAISAAGSNMNNTKIYGIK